MASCVGGRVAPQRNHDMERPESFSLTSHRRRCASASWAAAEGVATFDLARYLPVTPESSGEVAAQRDVRAPFSTLRAPTIPARTTARMTGLAVRAKSERTNPGCTAFEVTPVPSSRPASSNAKRMFINFEVPYAVHWLYRCSPWRLSQRSRPIRWAFDAVQMMRAGALAFNLGSRRFVRWK